MTSMQLRIAVLVPCYNEEAAVATVIADFRKALPLAEIYVYDNNSRDRTAAACSHAASSNPFRSSPTDSRSRPPC